MGRTSGKNPRFQIVFNGKPLAVAGVAKAGSLMFSAHWMRLDRSSRMRGPDGKLGDKPKHWIGSQANLVLMGNPFDGKQDHELWADEELAVGDEILLKVLPPGRLSRPKATKAADFYKSFKAPKDPKRLEIRRMKIRTRPTEPKRSRR